MLMKYEPDRRDDPIAAMKNALWRAHGLLQRVHDWLALRGDIYRLQGLDDHLLADMGIQRDEIEQRVKGRQPGRTGSRTGRL